MKKLIQLGTYSLVITSLIVGATSFVRAETGSSVSADVSTQSRIETNAKIQMESAVRAEKARCESMGDREAKICLGGLENRLKTRFQNMMGFKAENLHSVILNKETRPNMMNRDLTEPLRANKEGVDDDKNGQGHTNFVERFTEHFNKVIERLTAAYDRLNTLAGRIDSRIAKLKADGIDVTASVKFVATAREELRLAKVAINDAQTSFKTELNANTSTQIENEAAVGVGIKTHLVKTIASIQAAKEHLMKAHGNLVQAIVNLKMGTGEKEKMQTGVIHNNSGETGTNR